MKINEEDKAFLKRNGHVKTIAQWVEFFDDRYDYYQLKYFFEENEVQAATYSGKGTPVEEKFVKTQKPFNDNFFEEWTPESAQVIGQCFSHCTIHKNGIFDLMHETTTGDKEIFRKITNFLGYKYPIAERTNRNILRITFYCPKICADIMDKTDFVNFPPVPQEFLADFIRGQSDANMTTGKRPRSVVTIRLIFQIDNEKFFMFLNAALKKYAGIDGGQREYNPKKGHFYFYIENQDVYKYGAYIYESGSDLKMTKKWQKFLSKPDKKLEELLSS